MIGALSVAAQAESHLPATPFFKIRLEFRRGGGGKGARGIDAAVEKKF